MKFTSFFIPNVHFTAGDDIIFESAAWYRVDVETIDLSEKKIVKLVFQPTTYHYISVDIIFSPISAYKTTR